MEERVEKRHKGSKVSLRASAGKRKPPLLQTLGNSRRRSRTLWTRFETWHKKGYHANAFEVLNSLAESQKQAGGAMHPMFREMVGLGVPRQRKSISEDAEDEARTPRGRLDWRRRE